MAPGRNWMKPECEKMSQLLSWCTFRSDDVIVVQPVFLPFNSFSMAPAAHFNTFFLIKCQFNEKFKDVPEHLPVWLALRVARVGEVFRENIQMRQAANKATWLRRLSEIRLKGEKLFLNCPVATSSRPCRRKFNIIRIINNWRCASFEHFSLSHREPSLSTASTWVLVDLLMACKYHIVDITCHPNPCDNVYFSLTLVTRQPHRRKMYVKVTQ